MVLLVAAEGPWRGSSTAVQPLEVKAAQHIQARAPARGRPGPRGTVL